MIRIDFLWQVGIEVKSVVLIAKVSKLLENSMRAIHFSKTQLQSRLEKVSTALTRD